jgi:Ser/Thr protein kinase RdoA (MazF antagonist)
MLEIKAAAVAHGLDGKLVESDWAPLALDEVRALLRQFPACGEPIAIETVSPRPFSAASVVSTSGGRVFIKRHHRSVRDREGLLEEHRFLAHLRMNGAAVPRVLANVAGETAIKTGEWTYEVHETPAGVDLYRDALSWTPFRCVEHAYSAGQALARLHCAASGFDAPRRRVQPLVASFSIFASDDPGAEMDRFVELRPALKEYLQTRTCRDEALQLLAPFHGELQPLLPALGPLWTHNDLHASNLFWNGDEAISIIDFGLADRTNAVHDLAQAIERNMVEWLALEQGSGIRDQGSEIRDQRSMPVHVDHLNAMLDGYESVRPLSEAEAAALAPMTALGHAEFALSETDYFLSVLRSEEKAYMACEGWLVGHARWFHGEGSKKLLDAICNWAETRNRRATEVRQG